MKVEKRLPKLLKLPRHPSERSFESATRAISPISNNDGCFLPKNLDSFRSSLVSRNATPIDVIDNRYLFDAPQDKFKRASAACKHCKRLEREVENYKRALIVAKEKTALNEKHLKQYESLLVIKENRLKERENSINELYETCQDRRFKEKSQEFCRSEELSLKTRSLKESSVQTIENGLWDWPKVKNPWGSEDFKEKSENIEKNLDKNSMFSRFSQEDSSRFSNKLKKQLSETLTIDFCTQINLRSNKRSSSSPKHRGSQTEPQKMTKSSSKIIQTEFNLKEPQNTSSDFSVIQENLPQKEAALNLRLQKILEKESEVLKFSSNLQNLKNELEQKERLLSCSRKASFSCDFHEQNEFCDHFDSDENRKPGESCQSCKGLQSLILAQQAKKRDSLALSYEGTVGTTRQASVKSTPERNFSKLQESIIKDQQVFRSAQEVSSNLKISDFKSLEDNEYSFFKQLSLSGNSECIEGLTPIGKSFFLEKEDFEVKFEEKNNPSDDKSLKDQPHSDNSGNELFPQSRDEPTHQLSIVSRLKAKLQQKAYEAEQQVKLKEFFYQQENEKFMKIIQQFESFNSTLSKENQELKEKLKILNKELEELSQEKAQNLEIVRKFEEDLLEFNKKVEELNEENSKLEDLNEKLKARLLIYKNKRVTQDGAEVLHEELDLLIQQMHEKLLAMQEKEIELIGIKKELVVEHENNLNNAECLKILFNDLSREKKDLLLAKEEFAVQKSSIMDIEKSHQQQVLLLQIKENELLKFKEELIEKERLLAANFYRSPTRVFKRMNTQLGEFKQNSSDTF